jgi:HD superfamily phosphohydrolase
MPMSNTSGDFFYDPIYEVNNFETRTGFRLSIFASGKRGGDVPIDKLLRTFEMNRLNFVKQAGLAWLVFPSAVHTRFAHSLGSGALGEIALRTIRVGPSQSQDGRGSQNLRDWLYSQGYLMEFVIALLLHDIGHGPFSHILEDVPSVGWDHEEVGASIISGKGKFASIVSRLAHRRGLKTVFEVLESLPDFKIQVVEALLGSENANPSLVEELGYLRELISGQVDLDRIDHYARDSYYMGVKLALFNLQGILQNLQIVLNPDLGEKTICILPEGVPHVLQLLFSKETLWVKALDSAVIRGYETMLTRAIKVAVSQGRIEEEDYLATDEEFLLKLKSLSASRELVERILNKRPYALAAEFDTTESKDQLEEKRLEISEIAKVDEGDVLFHVPRNYKKVVEHWMNVYVKSASGVLPLEGADPEFFEYMNHKEKGRRRKVRIYVREQGKVERAIKKVLSS